MNLRGERAGRTKLGRRRVEIGYIAARAALAAVKLFSGIAVAGFGADAVIVLLDRDVSASALGAHGSSRRRHGVQHDAHEDRPHLFRRKVVLVVVAIVSQRAKTEATVPVVKMLAETVVRPVVVRQQRRLCFARHVMQSDPLDPTRPRFRHASNAPVLGQPPKALFIDPLEKVAIGAIDGNITFHRRC